MTFPLNVCLAAFAAALAGSCLSLPLWRAWCLRRGWVDDPGHRKIHDQPVPLAGGLAVLTGLLLPLLAALAAIHWHWLEDGALEKFQYGFGRRSGQLTAILLGAVGMWLLGWLDDRQELRPLPKFAGQLFMAALVASSGVRIPLFVPSLMFSYAITILWILTVTNAFNFMDNMNGLCAGLAVIGAGGFGLVALRHGQYLVAGMAFLIAGAALGFLPHNFPRATAFLGDAGSHLLGYLLAVLAILPHFHSPKHPQPLAVLTPLLLLAAPLADLVWVVILRWRLGKPFYLGDNNHLSHRLTRRGFSRVNAVLLIWLIAAALGALAFLL